MKSTKVVSDGGWNVSVEFSKNIWLHQTFTGELPHGHGVSYFANNPDVQEYEGLVWRREKKSQKINWKGDWVFGAKPGVGKLYYPSGSLLFYGKEYFLFKTSSDEFCLSGNLSDGLAQGLGTHYYENGNILFRGESASSSDQSEALLLIIDQSET